MGKRVLIITYYWPPAGGIAVVRWVKLVKYLRDYGWEPVVYTASNGQYPFVDSSLDHDLPDDLEIIRRPIWEPYGFYKIFSGKKGKTGGRDEIKPKSSASWTQRISIWLRGNLFIPDARAFWVRPSIRFLKTYLNSHPVDAIVSTGPPHSMHRIALGLKRATGIPWLADFRDPWTTMDYYQDLQLTQWADEAHRRQELEILRTADLVTVVGPAMKMEFEKKTTREVRLVTNGFDEADFAGVDTSLDAAFSIVYTGFLYPTRNPLSFWKALQALSEEGHPMAAAVTVKLIGQTDAAVLAAIDSFGLRSMVECTAFVPRRQAIQKMKSAQVLLLPIDHVEGAQWVLTGKLFEYLAAGRPVLCIGPVDGDAARILTETAAGTTLDFDDVPGIKKQLILLYDQFKSGELYLRGNKAQAFTHKKIAGQIAQGLDMICV